MSGLLKKFRMMGISLVKRPSGKLRIFSREPLSDEIRAEIMEHKSEISAELEAEAQAVAVRMEEQAEMIVRESQRHPEYVVVKDVVGDMVFISWHQKDRAPWTISMPLSEWDPVRIGTMLASASPEKKPQK